MLFVFINQKQCDLTFFRKSHFLTKLQCLTKRCLDGLWHRRECDDDAPCSYCRGSRGRWRFCWVPGWQLVPVSHSLSLIIWSWCIWVIMRVARTSVYRPSTWPLMTSMPKDTSWTSHLSEWIGYFYNYPRNSSGVAGSVIFENNHKITMYMWK